LFGVLAWAEPCGKNRLDQKNGGQACARVTRDASRVLSRVSRCI
jgi:hypothetical protein